MYKIDLTPPHFDSIDSEDELEFPMDLLAPIEDMPGLQDSPGLKEIMGLDREPTIEECIAFTRGLVAEVFKADSHKKGKETHPTAAKSKSVTLRVPGPVLVKFKAMAKSKGRPYQTEMNRILREAVKAQGDTSIS